MSTLFCKQRSHSHARMEGHGRMGRGVKVTPQATLSFMPGRPPVLDPCPAPQPAPHQAKPQTRRGSSWPGQMWSHMASMFTSRSPVYWVNEHMLHGHNCPPPPPPPHHHQPPYPVMPCVMDSGCSLWHAAPPGTTQHQLMMEPQQMLQKYPQIFPPVKQPPVYISNCPPPYQYSKTSLNPNAQEWVPKEYRKPCQDDAKVKQTTIPDPSAAQDFCEITEKEVQDIRTFTPQSGTPVTQFEVPVPQCSDSSAIVSQSVSSSEEKTHSPAEVTCSPAISEEESPKSQAVLDEVASPVVPPSSATVSAKVEQIEDPVPVSADTSASKIEGPHLDSKVLINQTSTTPKTSTTSQASTVSQVSDAMKDCLCVEVPQGRATGDNASLSYAGIVGRVSPPPPPPVDTAKLKYKGVEQPLPKIFQGDRSPSRQGDAPRVSSESRTPEFFKRPSKSQRTRSRRFLQELKELGQGRDICGSPSSLSDISVTSDDLSTPPMSPLKTPTLASSPQSRVPPLVISPQSGSHVPSPVPDAISSPIAIPVPIPACIGSPSDRTRTSSESSAASLDIEFVESDEVDRAVPDRATPMKRGPGAGGRNGFLACILGSGESDTETDDDSDWDECESDTAPTLDDSWETFGFGLVVVQCHVAPMAQTQKAEVPETHEEHSGDPVMREVNRKWEEEVKRNVRGKTNQRVSFGKETVHPMVVWGHAYRQARRGPWEQQARDRARFAQRVASLEADLSLVLDPAHRRRVYRRLYAPPTRCFL